jgi:adenine deaminase
LALIGDLAEMKDDAVFLGGELAARNGELLLEMPPYRYPDTVKHSVKRLPVTEKDLSIPSDSTSVTGRCIVAIPDQNLTDKKEVSLRVEKGIVQADPQNDVLFMCCVERYGRNGNIGKCFVAGMGLKHGAIAESVAHDTHNIIAAGTNLKDVALAVNHVIQMGGGISAVRDGKILDDLPLPVGGLITDELTGSEVSDKTESLEKTVREQLGGNLHAPFMHLSFLALSTSPKWKLTDKGLIDVENFEILPPILD